MDTPISSWLFPASDETRLKLEKVVEQAAGGEKRKAGPLRTLSAVARRALVDEIETKLRMVVGETLAELVMGGWRTHLAIKQAIQKSLNEPGVDQVVPLRNHTITASRSHDLDVDVDGVRVMTLTAQLIVRLQLYDAVAVVRDGHVVAVRSGQAKAVGTVTVEGVEVVQRSLTFPLIAELTLRVPRSTRPDTGT
jgi:hypothetical protein